MCIFIRLSFIPKIIKSFEIHTFYICKWTKTKTQSFKIMQRNEKGEEEVGKACLLNMFRCENGPCIDKQYRCNGRNDCPFDGSDELDCHTNRKSLSLSMPFRQNMHVTKTNTRTHKFYILQTMYIKWTNRHSHLTFEYPIYRKQLFNNAIYSMNNPLKMNNSQISTHTC